MIAITIRMLKMRFKAVFPPLLLFFSDGAFHSSIYKAVQPSAIRSSLFVPFALEPGTRLYHVTSL